MGFQVKALWNGKEALDYLLGVIDGKNVKPDIILMDVQMPTIDGYKVSRFPHEDLDPSNKFSAPTSFVITCHTKPSFTMSPLLP
jgi:CheY-like chemotaxis protein